MKGHMLVAKNSLTRRRFLEATAAGCIPVVFGDLGNLSIVTAGQGSCSSRLREWDHGRLSSAVLNHVGTELGSVYGAIQSRGSVKADNVRTAASNLNLLFGHLEEIRLAQALEQKMQECRQDVLNFVPQEEQLRRMSDGLAAFGVSLSPAMLREKLSLSAETKARALSELERTGIQGFAHQTVVTLNGLASRLEQQSSSSFQGSVTLKVRYVHKPFAQGLSPEDCHDLAVACAELWLLAGLTAFVGIFFLPLEAIAVIIEIGAALCSVLYALLCT